MSLGTLPVTADQCCLSGLPRQSIPSCPLKLLGLGTMSAENKAARCMQNCQRRAEAVTHCAFHDCGVPRLSLEGNLVRLRLPASLQPTGTRPEGLVHVWKTFREVAAGVAMASLSSLRSCITTSCRGSVRAYAHNIARPLQRAKFVNKAAAQTRSIHASTMVADSAAPKLFTDFTVYKARLARVL